MDTFHPFWTLFQKHSFQPFSTLKYSRVNSYPLSLELNSIPIPNLSVLWILELIHIHIQNEIGILSINHNSSPDLNPSLNNFLLSLVISEWETLICVHFICVHIICVQCIYFTVTYTTLAYKSYYLKTQEYK